MTRHRKRAKLYTKLPSATIRDERLMLRSLGVLAMILDLPEDWVVRADNLAAKRLEGRDAVAACLRNMAECGYYRVERRRMRNGRFQMGTAVSEDSVPEWEAEYREFGGKPIPLIQQEDGTFLVKRKDGRLTDDGFVGEFHPSRKKFPMPGELPGQTGNGFSGSGQSDLEPSDSETDITGPGFPGSDVPASGVTGPFSTTEKYGRDVSVGGSVGDQLSLGDAENDLRAVGALPTVTRAAVAPAAKRRDPVGVEAWRTAAMLPRRYREGLPRELTFPLVHEIRTAFYEGYEAAAVLRYAQVCEANADYAADRHLPLLRVALGLMRQDARLGLVCPACGTEPSDPFGPACHRCRPDRHELDDHELAQLEAARAYLEAGDPDACDHDEHAGPYGDLAEPGAPDGPHAAPHAAPHGARGVGRSDRASAPYSEPDGDLRGARGGSDRSDRGGGGDGGADGAPPG